jgi:HPt (histidine-containing phosphotransfer) domain-containing protein
MNVIDSATFAALKEMTGADFINELIDTFLAEAPLMLADLRRALAEQNAEVFRRSAHSLKSNSNTFGALTLGSLARELESLGRENQLAAVGSKLYDLLDEYGRVEAALKGLRDG